MQIETAVTAAKGRLLLIESKLGISNSDDCSDEFSIARRIDVLSQSREVCHLNGFVTTLVFLIYFGRYPTVAEHSRWSFEYQRVEKLGFFRAFISEPSFSDQFNGARQIELQSVSNETMLIEVTHTLDYPYNSGIQRVVRKIAETLQEKDVCFFKKEGGQPVGLTECEKRRLIHFFSSQIWTEQPFISYLLKRLLLYVRQDLGSFVKTAYLRIRVDFLGKYSKSSRIADWLLRKIDQLKPEYKYAFSKFTNKKTRKNEKQKVLFLFENRILYPEIDPTSFELYSVLKSSLPIELTILVYDLIPVIAPEYCIVVDSFARYLRLLRVVDRVSCISEAVKEDVIQYYEVLKRNFCLKQIVVQANLLGADILSHNDATFQGNSAIPMILSVGTLEPRKNQINVMRAAKLLVDKGLRFKLKFVGNPGWLTDEILATKKLVDPRSCFIDILSNVTDNCLATLYREAKFTVFCSHVEGFGLPILESLYFGKPVVTANRGSMKELAEKYPACSVVDPESPTELAAEIEALLVNDEYYQSKRSMINNVKIKSWREYSDELLAFATKG